MRLEGALVFTVLCVAFCQDLFLSTPQSGKAKQSPNIVWFITDDQDQMLGASFPLTSDATPMPKTKRLMQDEGIYADNWYIHTPICSPSRSELLTGRYFHNIKQVGGKGYCAGMHVNYTYVVEDHFAKVLKQKVGYTTGMFGKYVNEMGAVTSDGWDAWLANGGGDYIAPSFETKNIDGLPDGNVQFTNDAANYSTAVIGNTSMAWIKKVAKQGKPFFAYIGPKAAHEPFNPAPWYRDAWDPSWPEHEPRGENWNCSFESRKDHHGNVATEPMITSETAKIITGVFKNRWRTLMSVDDAIAALVATVDAAGASDNTYFFFTSDHGFQLGEFNFLMDKRHAYDWVTRVPLVVAGPGVAPGGARTITAPTMMTDLAPTLVELAGLLPHDWSDSRLPSPDGASLVPLLLDSAPDGSWRDTAFFEYYFVDDNAKCVANCTKPGTYPKADACCAGLDDIPNSHCWGTEIVTGVSPAEDQGCYADCYPTEDLRNNFIALRRPPDGILYVEYMSGNQTAGSLDFDAPDFFELFNATHDPWLTHNAYAETLAASPALVTELREELHRWFACGGDRCRL